MQSTPPESDQSFDLGGDDESLARMIELFARLGDTYRVYSPARKSYVYVINHPDDVKRVLVSNHRNYTKGIGLDRVKILLGNGIMTSEGEFWRRQRYMMAPIFHRKIITQFGATIDRANDTLLERWAALAARGMPVNVTDEMSEMTLEIILQAIFGKDLARLAPDGGDNPFAVVSREPTRDLRFAFKFRSLSKLVADLIRRRRNESDEHFDFLSMLMAARDKETGDAMTERELIDEVMTLVVAGHETTASGLNWTWLLLSQNPACERRMHAEIDQAPQWQPGSLVNMESLAYTHMVAEEALRLYPPGWLLSRRAIAADTLGGFDIPPGTDVLLSPYILHRHPRYWPDPEVFRPERFDAAHESERPRFAYMPFAAGPRHCIGESFAMYEMLMHLYKVGRRYRLVRADNEPIELEAQVNLRTRKPLFMKLEQRA